MEQIPDGLMIIAAILLLLFIGLIFYLLSRDDYNPDND